MTTTTESCYENVCIRCFYRYTHNIRCVRICMNKEYKSDKGSKEEDTYIYVHGRIYIGPPVRWGELNKGSEKQGPGGTVPQKLLGLLNCKNDKI